MAWGLFDMIYRNMLALFLLPALSLGTARAQEQGEVPGALPNPGTYQGSMQLQQQEQQRDQQVQQQNQAMQQRLDQNYRSYAPGNNAGGGMGGGGRAVNWFAKPPLPPEKNPLLGRWKQTGSKAPRVNGVLGQLSNPFLGGAMAGGCKSIFGTGVIAFEPAALQWVAPDGHEEILNHVGYRASGDDVVMVTRDPGAIPQLFFGFPNRDHAVVAVFGCTMERLGVKGPAAAPAAGAPRMASAILPPQAGGGDTRLAFQVGIGAPGRFAPLRGIKVWVTREDPTMALVRAGVPVRGDLVTEIDSDCHDVAACMRDWKAMTASALGFVTTDAGGHARTPVLKPGRYYLVGVAPYQGRHLFWHRPIDIRSGSNTVALDQTNASMIQ